MKPKQKPTQPQTPEPAGGDIAWTNPPKQIKVKILYRDITKGFSHNITPPPKMGRPKSAPPMRQVSFDIPETEYQKLLSIAQNEGVKPNTKARLVLLAFLGGAICEQ